MCFPGSDAMYKAIGSGYAVRKVQHLKYILLILSDFFSLRSTRMGE